MPAREQQRAHLLTRQVASELAVADVAQLAGVSERRRHRRHLPGAGGQRRLLHHPAHHDRAPRPAGGDLSRPSRGSFEQPLAKLRAEELRLADDRLPTQLGRALRELASARSPPGRHRPRAASNAPGKPSRVVCCCVSPGPTTARAPRPSCRRSCRASTSASRSRPPISDLAGVRCLRDDALFKPDPHPLRSPWEASSPRPKPAPGPLVRWARLQRRRAT